MFDFFSPEIPSEKVNKIRDQILMKADKLLSNPNIGKQDDYLEHMGKHHRRIIESNYKIIYRVEVDTIYITNIFDSFHDLPK